MQHFKFVNWWIRGFVFWCHEHVISPALFTVLWCCFSGLYSIPDSDNTQWFHTDIVGLFSFPFNLSSEIFAFSTLDYRINLFPSLFISYSLCDNCPKIASKLFLFFLIPSPKLVTLKIPPPQIIIDGTLKVCFLLIFRDPTHDQGQGIDWTKQKIGGLSYLYNYVSTYLNFIIIMFFYLHFDSFYENQIFVFWMRKIFLIFLTVFVYNNNFLKSTICEQFS